MEITEIRIKLMERSEDRLRGFCSITIENAFVIRDLKIIDGTNGPFVAMPSRKLSGNCQRCRHKNHLRSNYCNHCGTKLQQDAAENATPQKLYADVAHPINSECREEIQRAVLAELEAEIARCEQPGYRSRYDDDFDIDELEPRNRNPGNRELRTSNTASASSQEARSATREDATQTTESIETRSATGKDSEPHNTDREPETTTRVDNQATSAVPAPMLRQTEEPTRRQAAAQTDDDESFGAGIF